MKDVCEVCAARDDDDDDAALLCPDDYVSMNIVYAPMTESALMNIIYAPTTSPPRLAPMNTTSHITYSASSPLCFERNGMATPDRHTPHTIYMAT